MTQQHSGFAKSPRFGDFEAQRHWMEITVNLPLNEWYVNSTKNDLEYWGLDYPPLTAYHSWLCGKVAQYIGWHDIVALESSRGIETTNTKLFMRSTALLADLFIFIPAIIFYVLYCEKSQSLISKSTLLFTCLMQPSMVLIDHGHFQFNSICLGLSLWAVNALIYDHLIIASILFSLSLNYKQMALYYALPFFFFILRRIYERPTAMSRINKFVQVGLSVIATFAVCWLPFLIQGCAGDVLKRIFPVHRGLYEDKVANFWCSTSIFIKWNNLFTREQLLKITMITTLVSCIPFCAYILLSKSSSMKRLAFGLFGCSMSFYMFSFHVHEKTILLPLMPALLLLSEFPFEMNLFSQIATFSMYPLFYKDGIQQAYYVSMVLQTLFIKSIYGNKLYTASLFGTIIIQLINSLMTPPARYPDLFTYLCIMYSCAHFVLITAHVSRFQLQQSKKVKQA
ncbi:alpha-1,3-glucosyltransferase [Acrasis kona]|uniref:Alpha-1,3-glucosyltransferase n=1 Tax=Acrasis kona TaxID=1008807 RepID=A0AAW2YS35_9EUKA